MGAAGGNRNALNLEVGEDGQRDWSHGLFSCTEDRRLCMSTIYFNRLIIWLSPFSGRFPRYLLCLRGLFHKQAAPRTFAESWHSASRWG